MLAMFAAFSVLTCGKMSPPPNTVFDVVGVHELTPFWASVVVVVVVILILFPHKV